MAYEKEKDKTLWEKSVEVGRYTFDVKVKRYDKGKPKIDWSRKTTDGGEDKYLKFGRTTVEEAEALIPVIKEAGDFIKDYTGEE